jgi:hypothetical protein
MADGSFLQHTNGHVTRSNNGQIVVFNVLPNSDKNVVGLQVKLQAL